MSSQPQAVSQIPHEVSEESEAHERAAAEDAYAKVLFWALTCALALVLGLAAWHHRLVSEDGGILWFTSLELAFAVELFAPLACVVAAVVGWVYFENPTSSWEWWLWLPVVVGEAFVFWAFPQTFVPITQVYLESIFALAGV